MKLGVCAGLLLGVMGGAVQSVSAQKNIEISGLAYVDYRYVVASPLEEEEGDNAFTYRRVYLTTDYTVSETFSGRLRFEAKDASTTTQGQPAPFVKDLYLKWKNVWGEGHHLVFGVSPPPSFTVSEKIWGYRSLEATIMDRNKIVSSRDFGVVARGKLTPGGSLKYGLMVANNSGVKAEENKHKRVYGQVEWYPAEHVIVTVGGDYAGFGDERSNGTNLNAFAGYRTTAFRAGAEGFANRIDLAGSDATDDILGVTLFAAARLAETWEAIARIDQVAWDVGGVETSETFFLAGVAFQPHRKVRFIPNVLVIKHSEDEEARVTGRVTLHMDF